MSTEEHADFAACCASHFEADAEQKTAQVVARELQIWARAKLPMGAGAALSEKAIKSGLKDVEFRLKTNPQAYGIDPITLLTVISTLMSIVSQLAAWWKGRGQS